MVRIKQHLGHQLWLYVWILIVSLHPQKQVEAACSSTPPTVTNSVVTSTGPYNNGQSATYSCNTGYSVSGSSTVLCDGSSGSDIWQTSNLPQCVCTSSTCAEVLSITELTYVTEHTEILPDWTKYLLGALGALMLLSLLMLLLLLCCCCKCCPCYRCRCCKQKEYEDDKEKLNDDDEIEYYYDEERDMFINPHSGVMYVQRPENGKYLGKYPGQPLNKNLRGSKVNPSNGPVVTTNGNIPRKTNGQPPPVLLPNNGTSKPQKDLDEIEYYYDEDRGVFINPHNGKVYTQQPANGRYLGKYRSQPLNTNQKGSKVNPSNGPVVMTNGDIPRKTNGTSKPQRDHDEIEYYYDEDREVFLNPHNGKLYAQQPENGRYLGKCRSQPLNKNQRGSKVNPSNGPVVMTNGDIPRKINGQQPQVIMLPGNGTSEPQREDVVSPRYVNFTEKDQAQTTSQPQIVYLNGSKPQTTTSNPNYVLAGNNHHNDSQVVTTASTKPKYVIANSSTPTNSQPEYVVVNNNAYPKPETSSPQYVVVNDYKQPNEPQPVIINSQPTVAKPQPQYVVVGNQAPKPQPQYVLLNDQPAPLTTATVASPSPYVMVGNQAPKPQPQYQVVNQAQPQYVVVEKETPKPTQQQQQPQIVYVDSRKPKHKRPQPPSEYTESIPNTVTETDFDSDDYDYERQYNGGNKPYRMYRR